MNAKTLMMTFLHYVVLLLILLQDVAVQSCRDHTLYTDTSCTHDTGQYANDMFNPTSGNFSFTKINYATGVIQSSQCYSYVNWSMSDKDHANNN